MTEVTTNPVASSRSYNSSPRLVGLDVLRFIATAIVLCDHSKNFGTAGKFYEKAPGILGVVLSALSSMGWVAVDIFFVLSGFLVSSLLFQEAAQTGTVSPGRFLIRRGFKIYPAFWVMLAATMLWMWWTKVTFPAKAVFGELFYLQNYGWGLSFHTWSLAVEEHFYFLLAGLFLIVKWRTKPGQKISLQWAPNFCLAVAVSCLLLRGIAWAMVLDVNVENNFLFIHSDFAVIDSLFFGMLLSYFWHNAWNERTKRKVMALSVPLAIIGVCLLLPVWSDVIGIQWFRIFGFVLVYLRAGCLLLSSLALDYFRCPRWVRSLAWLGQYSYSVYLWHLLTGHCAYPLLSVKSDTMPGWILNALIYFASAWMVGIILARLIEFPVIRCRERWFPSAGQARGKAVSMGSAASLPDVVSP